MLKAESSVLSISLMTGLLQPDSGAVYLHGEKLNSDNRRQVGVCPQVAIFWDRLTCIEQLQFVGEMYSVPARLARERGDRLLEEFDLQDKRNVLAHKLSGGLQRRLNIALALIHDPAILIFDEPEAGLDPQSRIRVRDFSRSQARQKTVILTTHNMDEADRLADRVAIIDHGVLLKVVRT